VILCSDSHLFITSVASKSSCGAPCSQALDSNNSILIGRWAIAPLTRLAMLYHPHVRLRIAIFKYFRRPEATSKAFEILTPRYSTVLQRFSFGTALTTSSAASNFGTRNIHHDFLRATEEVNVLRRSSGNGSEKVLMSVPSEAQIGS